MYQLDVNKLLDFFGGDASIAQGFTNLGSPITVGAVQVWRHRREIPRSSSIMLFYMLADSRSMRFNLRNFIMGAENAK